MNVKQFCHLSALPIIMGNSWLLKIMDWSCSCFLSRFTLTLLSVVVRSLWTEHNFPVWLRVAVNTVLGKVSPYYIM